MKNTSFGIRAACSLMLASTLLPACGADDSYDADAWEQGAEQDESGDTDTEEVGSIEEALTSCATPDGTNAVMAALAVAAGHELGRWRAGLDFEVAGSVIRLTSGTGPDGKPRGRSRCIGGVCPRIDALLSFQNDNATGVYVQAETSTSRVLVNPPALRSRMVAKLQEQKTKDVDAKDGNTSQAPKTAHKLTGIGIANLGGCGPHYKFNVAFDATTTTPKPLPAQLKYSLYFADHTNGWVDFRNLGNNVVAIDPTYGLNEEDTTTSGSCAKACTKVTPANVANACCSCGGATKAFKRASFNANTYLCK